MRRGHVDDAIAALGQNSPLCSRCTVGNSDPVWKCDSRSRRVDSRTPRPLRKSVGVARSIGSELPTVQPLHGGEF
jgi:hypothetical protein